MTDDPFFGRPRGGTTILATPRTVHRSSPPAQTADRAQPRRIQRGGDRALARIGGSPALGTKRSRRARRVAPTAPGRRPVRPAVRPLRPRSGERSVDPARVQRRAKRRLGAFLVFVLLAVAGLSARLVDVQVLKPGRYVAYGLRQRDTFRALPAGRGAILDRDGQPFALSVAAPQVIVDPTQVVDARATAKALAPMLKVSQVELRKAFARKGRRYVEIGKAVTPTMAANVKAKGLPGISVEPRYVRANPSAGLAAPIVGRSLRSGERAADTGGQGISGLERQYDTALTGRPGRLYFERDPAGNTIAGGRQRLVPAKPGTDLYLTLDQSLQYETQQALADQVQATGAQGATAVIMHPSTGEVVAMASVERNADDTIADTTDVRPVTAVFEPGSVNKVITIAGAMEDGLVDPYTVMDVPDSLRLYDRNFTDHDPHPTSPWSVTDILVKSSNIGTIKIAQQLGADRLDHYLRAFGFGHNTGLGIGGESAGLLRPVQDWSGVDIGAVPIGQGISVTAMQMLSAYNVIANGGVYVAPKLVAATDDGHGRTPTAAGARHRVVSAKTAAAMSAMLDKVVTDGTGKQASVPGYRVGGKTGTARIPQGQDSVDGYRDAKGNYHYYSSFVGMVDGADLSIIVTVREAKSSIYGSDVAAPVFSRLATSALRRYQIPPPALAGVTAAVPDLSAAAEGVRGEDVTPGNRAAAG